MIQFTEKLCTVTSTMISLTLHPPPVRCRQAMAGGAVGRCICGRRVVGLNYESPRRKSSKAL